MKGSRPLTNQEISILSGCFAGRMAVRNRALFFLGANTGFRISELLSLTLGDLLDKDGAIKDRVTVARRNMKGKKSGRSVILNDKGKEAITPWLEVLRGMGVVHKDDFVFVPDSGDGVISRYHAWRILTRAYRAAGLSGKLGTHAMRKTFANNVYEHLLMRASRGEQVDPFRATSKALGHEDIKSTDKYLSFRTEDIDQSIQAAGV